MNSLPLPGARPVPRVRLIGAAVATLLVTCACGFSNERLTKNATTALRIVFIRESPRRRGRIGKPLPKSYLILAKLLQTETGESLGRISKTVEV